jgi:hypothetical protein
MISFLIMIQNQNVSNMLLDELDRDVLLEQRFKRSAQQLERRDGLPAAWRLRHHARQYPNIAKTLTMQTWQRSLCVLTVSMMLQGPAWSSETDYNLGVHAYRTKDYTSARAHWEKAVAEGEILGMNNLGFLLYNALGGPRDETRAVSLWTNAAKKGESESQWHLAEALENGKGTERDLMEAYAWYRCAVASMAPTPEDEEERIILTRAKSALVRVLSQLPEDKVAAAESRARDYVGKFSDIADARVQEPAAE